MKFDIFLSICQTEVDGYLPSERVMFQNFFDQLALADELGYGTAWVAETHLSCQTQKENPGSVIPHFKGEIGLNTDILQLAHLAFRRTKKINLGSAIRNIICNGGPIAHAEAVKTFLALHEYAGPADRILELGFAAGRFPFSNTAYGFYPQTELERAAWDVIKNKYFQEGTEIFLRLLRGEKLASKDISPRFLEAADFRDPASWAAVTARFSATEGRIALPHHWNFDKVGVIPFDVSRKNLRLTIGTHDPETQILANRILPVGVFNLSIVPPKVIEETHQRMDRNFHPEGGPWKREYMPRTVMVFIDPVAAKAKERAEIAWKNYWLAMEGTIDPAKIKAAVSNTIAGDAEEVLAQLREKYLPSERIMAWFDFNNHDNEQVKWSMRTFLEKVAPRLPS